MSDKSATPPLTIEALRELSDRATPREWAVFAYHPHTCLNRSPHMPCEYGIAAKAMRGSYDEDEEVTAEIGEADADFIVACVTYVRAQLSAAGDA